MSPRLSPSGTHFISDAAPVVRYSELVAAYEEVGSLRALAERYGVVPSTVMRHLHAAGVDTSRDYKNEELSRLRARVAELEAANV